MDQKGKLFLMTKNSKSDDPRFHYEIWKGPSSDFASTAKSIYYVENHNAQCCYSEIAIGFGYSVDLLIDEYRRTGLGNWVAPVAYMSRQLIELRLKALMEAITLVEPSFVKTPLGTHNLQSIWEPCRRWLIEHSYQLEQDARLAQTDSLIEAYNEIDPGGDLFRFGISRRTAFGKQKSCDRVGIVLEEFEQELCALRGLLEHWEATIVREVIKAEMGWDEDPHFDPTDFPRISSHHPQSGTQKAESDSQ